jgi:beta-lactam-binding protein with PASTA domain
VPAGDVVSQDPEPGSSVAVGSTVSYLVSLGVEPNVAVPAVRDLSEADAVAAIEDAGLVVGETIEQSNEDVAVGDAIKTVPAADEEISLGSEVALYVSAGPPLTLVPEVKGLAEADANAAIAAAGLVVGATEQKTNATVPAGQAVKTEPAAGSEVQTGSAVTLTVSKGPKQVSVPAIVGLAEADAQATLAAAEVTPGARSEVNDPAVPNGVVLSQDPQPGTVVIKDSPVAYVVSLGPPIQPLGAGGTLQNPTVSGQLDAAAAAIPTVRELPLGAVPYDAVGNADQKALLSPRSQIVHDPASVAGEDKTLKRLGLLGPGDDLASLLDRLYGQELSVAYQAGGGNLTVLNSLEKLTIGDEANAAREFGRTAVDQQIGISRVRVSDPAMGDQALAGLALEQGDGTAVMLDWAASNIAPGNQSKVEDVIVPGDDGTLASLPQILQREYNLPFLEGRLFVDRLREAGGWASVNNAWASPPESTEQILHPKLYPGERPTSIDLGDLAGRLGAGWVEAWRETMGELRIAVWLADGQPGTQEGPKAPIELPKANAAAGWGGDRLVSLDGPDGTWAIVWQTKWDSPEDVGQFVEAANAAIADLPGAHAVIAADVSTGISDPALVLLTSDPNTLANVKAALGLAP